MSDIRLIDLGKIATETREGWVIPFDNLTGFVNAAST